MHKLTNRNREISERVIRSTLAPFGCECSPGMVGSLRRYLRLLQVWNKRMSLTSLEDTREILTRHFGESLFAFRAVPILHGRLADVGSGAGFPGLPLKMACPELDLLLIESNTRKVVFLAEVVRSLRLTGVQILNTRMDEVNLADQSLDFVTARALGDIPSLLRWSESLLKAKGKIVLWLGAADAAEIPTSAPGWVWRSPKQVPRSKQRVLLVGQRGPR
jgi:16S rRNA (guanine527-N7)-methyltransferase